jgi:prophage regulatory protein
MSSLTIAASVRAKKGAEVLGIAVATFWRWQKERPDMPRARRLSARCTVFDLHELMEWRDAHISDQVVSAAHIPAKNETAQPTPSNGFISRRTSL